MTRCSSIFWRSTTTTRESIISALGLARKKAAERTFAWRSTSADFALGVRPVGHLSVGAKGGYLAVNTGRGNNDNVAFTEDVFTPETTPGLDNQTNFLRGGFFGLYDYRDSPGGPRSGGKYSVEYMFYNDRDLKLHNFRRLDLEIQQYIPFFAKRRVIVLRAKSVLTYPDDTVLFAADDRRIERLARIPTLPVLRRQRDCHDGGIPLGGVYGP